jgi:CarboxypepD_reg-like domain
MGTRLQLLKHALAALWFFSGLQVCLAQGSISGRVTDASGEALIGATAILQNTNFGSTTDEDGVYVIKNVPAGEYLMSVSYVSFQTIQLKVSVGTGVTQVDVELSTGALNLDNITVTSTRSGRTQREAAMSLTQLSAAQIGRLSAHPQLQLGAAVYTVVAQVGFVKSALRQPKLPESAFYKLHLPLGSSGRMVMVRSCMSHYSVMSNYEL